MLTRVTRYRVSYIHDSSKSVNKVITLIVENSSIISLWIVATHAASGVQKKSCEGHHVIDENYSSFTKTGPNKGNYKPDEPENHIKERKEGKGARAREKKTSNSL